MDFIDDFIAKVNSLPYEQQILARDRVKTLWSSKSVSYGVSYNMLDISQTFNNLKVTGKVTFPKLMSALGIKKQEDKNRFFAFVAENNLLFTVTKGEITQVFLSQEFNPLSRDFKVTLKNRFLPCLLILSYNDKLWLTQYSFYLSVVNTKEKLMNVLAYLGVDVRAGKPWNQIDIYNFDTGWFESTPYPAWEITPAMLSVLTTQHVTKTFHTRGVSLKYSLTLVDEMLKELNL